MASSPSTRRSHRRRRFVRRGIERIESEQGRPATEEEISRLQTEAEALHGSPNPRKL